MKRSSIYQGGESRGDGSGAEESGGEFGREYPMYIAGQKVTTTEKMKSTNPSRPSQVIGVSESIGGTSQPCRGSGTQVF